MLLTVNRASKSSRHTVNGQTLASWERLMLAMLAEKHGVSNSTETFKIKVSGNSFKESHAVLRLSSQNYLSYYRYIQTNEETTEVISLCSSGLLKTLKRVPKRLYIQILP